MDEAAYVNKGLFFETIVPLLGMQTAALICISTPLTERNWFSALLNAKEEDGSPFFNIVRIGLVCKKCLKLSQAEMSSCRHMENKLPPWKDSSRNARMKILYKYAHSSLVEPHGQDLIAQIRFL